MIGFEITVKVNEELSKVEKGLEEKGFKKIRTSRIEDKYMASSLENLKCNTIIETLKKCVLLRYLKVGEDEFRKITYKNKVYDGENVISEEKINLNCEDLEKAESLFKALEFKKLIDVKYNVIVWEKDGFELAFQEVENLGLLLEYESTINAENLSIEDIKLEKKKMLDKIKSFGIDVSEDLDIKKAYELVKLKYNL